MNNGFSYTVLRSAESGLIEDTETPVQVRCLICGTTYQATNGKRNLDGSVRLIFTEHISPTSSVSPLKCTGPCFLGFRTTSPISGPRVFELAPIRARCKCGYAIHRQVTRHRGKIIRGTWLHSLTFQVTCPRVKGGHAIPV